MRVPPKGVAVLSVSGHEVARYVWQAELPLSSSPRPYLHPVRTLGGRTVTDAAPDSHSHQYGISVAFPDIDGCNFWGGRTFVAGHGPAWLNNHGQEVHRRWLRRAGSGLAHLLDWVGADESVLLRERRVIGCRAVDSAAWALSVHTQLTNATERPLTVCSPAAKGRIGAGYGGFFWRGSAEPHATVLSPFGEGVEPIHGRAADWVAVTTNSWSLLFLPGDAATARDRWFVRARDYLGVCSALAWDEPLTLAPGGSIARQVITVVVDGPLDPEVAAKLARSVA
ncbi:PmoA family protein [Nonomuraea diastatica]|uniref:Oxidoreductase n=1 Tax=Nonomuraea diastatica TaxID=1848329 RepID=A0A4R4W6H0_9ACTN|nr:PmoA family protein [Nonomuraea diastatica]TDD14238.1 oxidoreductase [Nonomuraea diastatica]